MLILSEAALRYAVDICIERKSNIIIAVCDSMECKRVSERLDEIIEHKDYFQKKAPGLPYAIYRHKNGSVIEIVPATSSARGYRCNVLIIQREILDTPDQDRFLAMEFLGYGEWYQWNKENTKLN